MSETRQIELAGVKLEIVVSITCPFCHAALGTEIHLRTQDGCVRVTGLAVDDGHD